MESGFSRLWYGVRVVHTTLQSLLQSTITGTVVQGFEKLFCTCYSRGLFGRVTQTSLVWFPDPSCMGGAIQEGSGNQTRPLWFGSSQANRSIFNTLSWHSPLAAVSRSTSIMSLRFGSSASPSSPFSSSCYVGSHCSAFLSC